MYFKFYPPRLFFGGGSPPLNCTSEKHRTSLSTFSFLAFIVRKQKSRGWRGVSKSLKGFWEA